jgi:hypothetical protein
MAERRWLQTVSLSADWYKYVVDIFTMNGHPIRMPTVIRTEIARRRRRSLTGVGRLHVR